MLAGQTADAFYASVSHADLLSIGLNCATGPEFMTDHIRSLHELASTRISCYPNAGLPDEDGQVPGNAGNARRATGEIRRSWLAEHRRRLLRHHARITSARSLRWRKARSPRPHRTPTHRTYFSGIELVEAEESNRPLIVGERTNVIGSRLFKNMIAEEKWEEATEIARWQIRNGAHIVDVCLQSSDRDEMNDIPPFYEKLIRKIKAPIMIDTTDPRSIELALTYCQGKSDHQLRSIWRTARRSSSASARSRRQYGAALVVGCIDEDPAAGAGFHARAETGGGPALGRSADDEVRDPAAEDIIIDPLVFPCATGDENYIGGAVETIEAIRLIKEQIPLRQDDPRHLEHLVRPARRAREVVNSVFLYYCTKAGLDLAIVNAEKLERFASIPEEERRLAEALLFNTPPADVPHDHPMLAILIGRARRLAAAVA